MVFAAFFDGRPADGTGARVWIKERLLPVREQLSEAVHDCVVDALQSRATSVHDRVGIAPRDVEICIQESPACNWGFRGLHGDEATLNYVIKL